MLDCGEITREYGIEQKTATIEKIVVRSLNWFLDWQHYSCSGNVTLNDQLYPAT